MNVRDPLRVVPGVLLLSEQAYWSLHLASCRRGRRVRWKHVSSEEDSVPRTDLLSRLFLRASLPSPGLVGNGKAMYSMNWKVLRASTLYDNSIV